MELVNYNKIKKVRVQFPNIVTGNMVVGECEKRVMQFPEIQNINNRMYSEIFAGASGMEVGHRMMPRVQGFNCTWLNSSHRVGTYVDAQFTFASSEEKKVMRIISKYGGKILDTRADLDQMGIEETNMSGKMTSIERVNEVLEGKAF